MTFLLAILALPCVYWVQGPETAPAVKAAGFAHVCVPAEAADSWRTTGISVTPVTTEELASREALPAPGLLVQPGLASPTRNPWVTANGWRFIRNPSGHFRCDAPPGTASLVASEALAYGADVLLTIAPGDLADAGRLLASWSRMPDERLPAVADFAVIDDGSAETGELMNLLVRRNLLFERLTDPGISRRYPLVVRLGTPAYAREEAADPVELALKVRRQLTDRRRSLRIFGSEVVIGRLMADDTRARLHLLNYGGRTIDGLRVRVHGLYRIARAWVAGLGQVEPTDVATADGATEWSLPALATYAVIDLERLARK